jgi:digeranylgeranylglycerophospholipid reductase
MSDIETCAFARVHSEHIEQDRVQVYFGSTMAPGGYVWVFPRGQDIANVGLGILGEHSSAGKAMYLLEQFLKSHFPHAKITDKHCGGVPVAKYTRPLTRDGVLLVGDAARQVNCLNGGGLMYSFYAGKTAGTIAAQAFKDGAFESNALKKYEKLWAKSYGRYQLRSYSLKKLASSLDDAELDAIADDLLRRPPHKRRYVQIFIKALMRNPVLLFRAFRFFKI